LGAARPTTVIASQYITADKPEVTASYTSQEVTTSNSHPAHPNLTRSQYKEHRSQNTALWRSQGEDEQ